MERINELLARLTELTADEMTELSALLNAEADRLLDLEPTAENLEALRAIATNLASVAAEEVSRDEADAQAQADKDALAAQIAELRGEGGDPDPDAPAGDGDGAPAEGEPAPAEGAAAPAPVAAAARPAPRITGGNARRPKAMTPTPAPAPQRALVAAGNFGNGIGLGERLDSADKLATAFLSAFDLMKGSRDGTKKFPVARMTADIPEDRFLGPDVRLNKQRIDAVTSPQALAAAGGICAPFPISYDMPTVGEDSRPIRDQAMTRFGADRGGTRTLAIPGLDDLDGAVGIWTEANDVNPSDPATKPCLTMTCPEDDESVVEAITKCLEVGNFRSRYFPEQVEAWLNLANVVHARVAETQSLLAIAAGSTLVTSGQLLGAAVDVLTTLDRAIAGIESRYRDTGLRLRFVAPRWLKHMLRTDIARQMPVGTVDENLVIAEAKIDSFFTSRNVNVTWTLDGESGQVFGAQGDGPLLGWPSTVVTYLYPEGTWLFLDGGSLDLGMYRDSGLIGTNDFRIFAETFEAAHFHGTFSYRLTMDLCPDGSRGALVDINPCTTGS